MVCVAQGCDVGTEKCTVIWLRFKGLLFWAAGRGTVVTALKFLTNWLELIWERIKRKERKHWTVIVWWTQATWENTQCCSKSAPTTSRTWFFLTLRSISQTHQSTSLLLQCISQSVDGLRMVLFWNLFRWISSSTTACFCIQRRTLACSLTKFDALKNQLAYSL